MKAQYIGKAQIVLLAIMILLGCILICSASECGVAAADGGNAADNVAKTE